jgi:hypothetical protein
MLEQRFLSAGAPPASHPDVFGPLPGAERALWQGRCAVAEYAFDQAASLPRWALPETTEVLITDQRVMYAYTRSDSPDDLEVTSGELRWLWPQHLRVQPGARTAGRAAAAAQIQLVCAASDGSFPALVFAGGDLATVNDADQMANLIRHAIARFRVDNAEKLGLTTPQARMLSRLLIGPEFSNFQGGEGQTVTLLGALSVHRPTQHEALPAAPPPTPIYDEPSVAGYDKSAAMEHVPPAAAEYAGPAAAGYSEPAASEYDEAPAVGYSETSAVGYDVPGGELSPAPVSGPSPRIPGYRPGLAADEARALQAAAAEQATHLTQPDLANRAASLAARVASLVSATDDQAATDWAVTGQPATGWATKDQPATGQATPWQTAVETAAAAARAASEVAAADRAAIKQAAAEQAAAEQAAAQRAAAQQAAAQQAAAQQAAAQQAAAERAAAEQAAADRRDAIDRAAAEEAAIAEQIAAERAAADRAAADWAAAQAAARQAAAEQAADQLVDFSDGPTTDLTARADNVRRVAARFTANSARGKAGVRRPEPEIGSTSRGNRNR